MTLATGGAADSTGDAEEMATGVDGGVALGALRAMTGVSPVGSREPLHEAIETKTAHPRNRHVMGPRYTNTLRLPMGEETVVFFSFVLGQEM